MPWPASAMLVITQSPDQTTRKAVPLNRHRFSAGRLSEMNLLKIRNIKPVNGLLRYLPAATEH